MSIDKYLKVECFNCDSAYALEYSEETVTNVPEYCPFCSEPLEDIDDLDSEDSEDSEEDDIQ